MLVVLAWCRRSYTISQDEIEMCLVLLLYFLVLLLYLSSRSPLADSIYQEFHVDLAVVASPADHKRDLCSLDVESCTCHGADLLVSLCGSSHCLCARPVLHRANPVVALGWVYNRREDVKREERRDSIRAEKRLLREKKRREKTVKVIAPGDKASRQ